MLTLFFCKASNRSAMLTPKALSLAGEKAISYCLMLPPMEFTSTTPGIIDSWRRTVQSCMVRSSCGVYRAESATKVYR